MFSENGIFAPRRWAALWADRDLFIDAFLVTLKVALLALVVAMILGVIFGLFSTSRSRLLRAINRIYVEFFQNTPLALQATFMYYGLVMAGIKLDKATIGIISVGLYHGAYISEVVRAGIESIPKGQSEAAASQGFTHVQTMVTIILPQTIRVILPPMANQLVSLIKNTSVLAMIAGGDLMYRSNAWASNGTLSYGPAYLICGLLYFILCYPFTLLARRYEENLHKKQTQSEAIAKGGAAE